MDAAAERDAWLNYDPSSSKMLEEVTLPLQKFVVFQLAHSSTAIRSHDGKPWMRCIGFTATLDEARTLAKATYSETRGETRIMPVARNFLASKSMYTKDTLIQQTTDQYRSNAMVDAWVESRKQAFEDVRRRAEGHTTEPAAIPHVRVDDIREGVDVADHVGKALGLPQQVYWAAAIIPDAIEPSIIPLFATASEHDMREFVDIAARCKDLVHFPIHVAPTCTWLPLVGVKSTETVHKHPLRQKLESRLSWKGLHSDHSELVAK